MDANFGYLRQGLQLAAVFIVVTSSQGCVVQLNTAVESIARHFTLIISILRKAIDINRVQSWLLCLIKLGSGTLWYRLDIFLINSCQTMGCMLRHWIFFNYAVLMNLLQLGLMLGILGLCIGLLSLVLDLHECVRLI